MIEFIHDATYTKNVDELFPGRVRIIGLGQTGIAACDQLMLRGSLTRDLWVIDTDQQAVDGAIVSSKRLIGRTINHGLGCGGDRDLAREIVSKEEMLLTEIVHGTDFLILIVGLAGATGVVLAESLIRLAHKMETKVIVVGVKPLPFEGKVREARCTEALATLRRDAHGVLVLSQDQLAVMPVAQRNIRYGFHCLHQLLATTAEAVAQIVCKRGLIQLSFADIRSLYGRYAGTEVEENFWLSFSEDPSHDSLDTLVPNLLQGPVLADPNIWKCVDNAIAVISGPRKIALSDVQDLVVELQRSLPIKIPISTSACLESADTQPVRLVLLLARTGMVTSVQPTIPQSQTLAPFSATVVMPASSRPSPPPKHLSDTTPMPGPVRRGQDTPSSQPVPESEQPTVALPFVQPLQFEPVLNPEELAELAELSALADNESFALELPKSEPSQSAIPVVEPAPAQPSVSTAAAKPVESIDTPSASSGDRSLGLKSETPIQPHPQLKPPATPVFPKVPLVFPKIISVPKTPSISPAAKEAVSTDIPNQTAETAPKLPEPKVTPSQPLPVKVQAGLTPSIASTSAPISNSAPVSAAPTSGSVRPIVAKLAPIEKASETASIVAPQAKETPQVATPKIVSEKPTQQPIFTARPSEIRRPYQQPAVVASTPPTIQNPPPTSAVVRTQPVIVRQAEPKREEPERKAAPQAAIQNSNRPPKQEEIQFEPVARGRFEKAAQTIYRGEDLDQPAFRRRRLAIRL